MRNYLLALAFVSRLALSDSGRTNEAQEALILDPAAECSPYDYPPVDAVIGGYPTIWATADMSHSGVLPADLAIFNALKPNIPKIAPRGTRTGDTSGSPPYDATDPACWWTYSKCTTPKIPGIPADVTRCNEPNTWGYTLDDGPSCSHNQFFNYLDSIQQKATLFYIGSNVLNEPLEAQRGLADGHEICAHTWSHPYMTALTDEQVFAELYYSKKAIYDVMGITVECWRPPSGDVDDRVRYIANAIGMKTILWSYDVNDWKHSVLGVPAVQAFYDVVIAEGLNGTFSDQGIIVLSHELDDVTMGLSQANLPAIGKAFTGGIMPIAVCTNNTQPYGEQGGQYVYPDAALWKTGKRTISLKAPFAGRTDPMVVGIAPTATDPAPTAIVAPVSSPVVSPPVASPTSPAITLGLPSPATSTPSTSEPPVARPLTESGSTKPAPASAVKSRATGLSVSKALIGIVFGALLATWF